MKPILIVVNTFNRRDLTGISLDSIQRNKSSCSDVLVIDDASTEYDSAWFAAWKVDCLRSPSTVGVGAAAQRRFQEFVRCKYSYVCTLDNDVLLARHFDLRMLELFCQTDDSQMTVVSGYHSNTLSTFAPKLNQMFVPYLESTTVNGICQFTDHATALRILGAMEGRWEHNWDANLSSVLTRIIVPRRSLVQHLGIHGNGVNGQSSDVAVDFVGDGL